jgi:hypothetical protein
MFYQAGHSNACAFRMVYQQKQNAPGWGVLLWLLKIIEAAGEA